MFYSTFTLNVYKSDIHRHMVWMWKLMTPHTHQESTKRLITFIRRSGLTPTQVQNGLINRGSETGWVSVVVKGKACVVCNPQECPRGEGAMVLLSAWPDSSV